MKPSLILPFALAVTTAMPAAAAGPWSTTAAGICAATAKAESLAGKGQAAEAKATVVSAYFDAFEGSRMEIAERSTLGADHTAEVEEMFNALRKAVAKPGEGDVHALAARLCSTVTADASALDAKPTEAKP